MSPGRALVVDDEPEIVRLCSRLLSKAGYEVTPAESPAVGLGALRDHPFDLALLDIWLPGMDGFALMREALALQPDLAVVFMTGYGTIETAIKAMEEGAAGLILKPFESNDAMLRQVQQAYETNRARRDAARSRILQPIFGLTEALFSETEESSLGARVVNAVRSHLNCSVAGVYLKEEASAQIRLVAKRGEGVGLEAEVVPALGRSAERLAVIYLSRDGADLEPADRDWLEAGQLGSAMVVPVRRSQGTCILLAARPLGEAPFNEPERETLILLARQVAVALENARLYGALRSYVREVERSQQRLVQTEKLAAIGRMMASIAHEVNNPLQSMRNCLDLAGREGVEGERQAEYLRMARKELDRLSWIVRHMLEFYRPEASSRNLVDMNQLVRDVVLLTTSECQTKGIALSLELEEGLPQVWGAAFQLQQVALNLAINAIDAMPDGGKLAIHSGRRRDRVEVSFHDTGVGIPRQDLPRLFEPFYTSKEGGTGLGLAISYGIVAAHSGTMEVESDPGAGTTIRVLLPPAAKE
ncbi:MAG TPA: ATP-binding protein [Anaerolineales bacterium]|nr:ATP-binding protein [Anaerolineales bacterium]